MKRKTYTPEDKARAVTLAREIGATKAADQLKLAHGTMYHWLEKAGFKPGKSKPTAPSTIKTKRKYTRKEPVMQVIPAAPVSENIVVIVTKPSALRSVLEQLGHE